MRSRSIPPRTGLTVLRERRQVEQGRTLSGVHIIRPRLGRPGEPRPQRYGRIYAAHMGEKRRADIVIPPRSLQVPSHQVSQTPNEYSIRIHFPVPLAPADIRWELNGDVLEVEYLGQSYGYYHNFLVPTGWLYTLHYEPQSFLIKFTRPEAAAASSMVSRS